MQYLDSSATSPRAYLLAEANLKQLQERRPKVAVLPWGATEAHNYHLPHGTDNTVATAYAHHAAALAYGKGAQVVVLPVVPFGNNAQHIDQVATIHMSTATTFAILRDVCHSLESQGIDRLVIVNGHGGNDFKQLVRDLQNEYKIMIVQVNVFQLIPQIKGETFPEPGNHAGDSETSIMLHICPSMVVMGNASDGRSVPFDIPHLKQPGVWTPRIWSKNQPETGAGDPRPATAEKGKRVFEAGVKALADVLVSVAAAKKGELPYV
ncbi:MAG: creatininase family protein, partial [Phycisphaerales bacterium]|nr:creatininase family protein [Phycisphaerales bacterium]